MTESIYWYDFETTGTDPIVDRPLQFAGLRTDLNLEEIAEPQNFFCRPGDDAIPQPGALLVTGILMSEVKAEGLIEREFTERILAEFSQPRTCVTGFNNLRFDDEFTRQMLYRNLRDPYAREWRGGNSRWDVIDLFRAAYALRPDGFVWPEREPGVPSFRLEDLSRANGIEHLDAHDALADVRATIAVTRLLRQAQPRLYDFAFHLKNKDAVRRQLSPLGKDAFVHVSSMYPAAGGCTAVVLPICQHPDNSNAIICFDLSQDPGDLLRVNPTELARLVFSKRGDLDADEQRIALKSIHVNKSPIVAPMGTLAEPEAERLGIDLARCNDNLARLRGSSGLVEKIQEAWRSQHFEDVDDPDFRLYGGGFFSDADRSTMEAAAAAPAEQVAGFEGRFQDERLDEMLFRYRARNWPEQMNKEEKRRWDACRLSRWHAGEDLAVVEAEVDDKLAGSELSAHDRVVLEDLRQYVSELRESVGLVS